MAAALRILHLEDDPLDSELIPELLSEDGLPATIDRVDTWADFNRALDQHCHSLVLSDYTIPGVDPLQTLRLSREKCPRVPFIFVSGTMGEDTAIESLKLGASDYVLKQRMQRLAPAVRRALKEAEEQARRVEADESLRKAKADLERIVAERTARLRDTISELESFSYSVSHDMRAPLRAMQNFSLLLKEEYGQKLEETALDYLDPIANSAERLDVLIQDVLSYSRVDRTEMKLQVVDLEKLVRRIIKDNPAFQAPGAQINIQSPLQSAVGDEASLTQCLINLLSNAVKFVPHGQVPQVRIRSELCSEPPATRQFVRFWVEDNGIGIPPKNLPRLFTIFQRFHSGYEGTGIGLAIVRKAAERMGGKVGAESEPGKGSRFWLELKAA